MNMAIRELMVENDEDLDGGTGTISDDSNPDNDPDIGGAQVFVTALSSGGFVTTLTSQARAGDALRVLKASFE